MPNAATHLILAIVLVDIYRHYFAKHKFPRMYVLIAGIAGLFPDIDMPIGWIYNLIAGTTYTFHGGITHILLIPVLIFVGSLVAYKLKNHKLGLLLGVIAFGWFFHIAIDCGFLGAYLPFWPFYTGGFCPNTFSSDHMAGLDAVVLIAWLIHEEFAHEIKDYI
jgi:hypothetical protein